MIAEAATEASLAENVHRLAMNAVDQLAAWGKMADEGLTPAEIARRHGATERQVLGRLKLARLSPEILDALRTGQIGLEQAQAYALSDDHAAQEAAFKTATGNFMGGQPHYIRQLLTAQDVNHSDKRARYVGIEAYQAAGGRVREDLFGEGRYLQDNDLLTRLALEKLQAEAETVRGDGWAQVVVTLDRDFERRCDMRRLIAAEREPTPEERAEADRLAARIAEIDDLPESDEEEDDYALAAEREQCWQQLDAIRSGLRVYEPEDKARATVFVYLDHDGEAEADYAYMPVTDATAQDESGEDDDGAGEGEASDMPGGEPAQAGPDYGRGVRDDMAALRRPMIQAEFLVHPEIAQDYVRFHMIRQALAPGYWHSLIQISARTGLGRTKSSAGDMGRLCAPQQIEEAVSHLRMDWTEIEDKAASFEAFRALSEADKVALVAYIAGLALNGTLSDEVSGDPALETALARMESDLSVHWTPDAAFFGRLTKAHILDLMVEIFGRPVADRHREAKKTALAEQMARYFNADLSPAERNITDEAAAQAAAWTPQPMQVPAAPEPA